MKRHSQLSFTIAASALALAVAGCGGTTQKPAHTTTNKAAAPAVSKAAPPSGSTAAAVSGKWTGQYSGAFSGTFALNWQQAGSSLHGRITLSAPPSTLGINGSLAGGAIKFGTVGGGVVYTGAVTGSSMSGDYQTPRGGGSWSATKS